ncbi:hypothetical protein [Actinokineospora bangkokensis]|uniref:Tox-PL domain-containing protein n=1 Tax=Actinokineospora bangkokensis TaxID=1193682 RepID=A0A1Q9LJI1_9PSEU|nr:hypothetical protein [Actinokineospora bangkokensis]OLR92188.1 hypothetical protein BJP25_22930 [Actinokineospora bangkokensis]
MPESKSDPGPTPQDVTSGTTPESKADPGPAPQDVESETTPNPEPAPEPQDGQPDAHTDPETREPGSQVTPAPQGTTQQDPGPAHQRGRIRQLPGSGTVERSAFEVRRFETPQGPVTRATVRIDLRGDGPQVEQVWQDATQGVREHFGGQRLPNGDRLEVEIVRVGPGEPAHHTVDVTTEGTTDQTTWQVGQPPTTYAHEVGHMLGLPDEYGRGLDVDGTLMGNHTGPDVRMPSRYAQVIAQHIGDVPVRGRVDTRVTAGLPQGTPVPRAPQPGQRDGRGNQVPPPLGTTLETGLPQSLVPPRGNQSTTVDQQVPPPLRQHPVNQDQRGESSRDNGNRDNGNRDNGNRDNGNRDNGNRDNGNRDNGNRDNGNRDQRGESSRSNGNQDQNNQDQNNQDQNNQGDQEQEPTVDQIRNNLPGYLRNNESFGVASQRTNLRAHGANPLPNVLNHLRQANPGVRTWTGVDRIQGQLDNNFGPMVGGPKKFTVHGDGRPYEFSVQARPDWNAMTQGESTDDKLSASGKEKRTGSTTHSDTREQSISPSLGFSGLPPLVFSINPTVPTGPTDSHTTELKGEYGQSTKVEVGKARDVTVPVDFTFTLGTRPPTTGRAEAGVRVPQELGGDGFGARRPAPAAPPKRFAVESVTNPRGDFADQVITGMGNRFRDTTRIGSDGRQVLLDFTGNDTIKSKLPTMATRANPGPNEGWVRSETITKGGFGFRPKAAQVEMRAVPRFVEVENDVRTGVKTTDTDRTHLGVGDQGGVARKGGVSGFIGAGADFLGKGTFAVGPSGGYSRERENTQKHESSTAVKDRTETKGDVVRYRVVYDIQVRTMGNPTPITLNGQVTAHQWTTAPRARAAGLIGPAPQGNRANPGNQPADNQPGPSNQPNPNPGNQDQNNQDQNNRDQNNQDQNNQQAPDPDTDPTVFRGDGQRQRFGPDEFERGGLIPGQFEQFSSNDWFYNTIAPMLRDIPLRRGWGLNTKEFVRQFDDPAFAKGMSGKVKEILDRDKNLHNSLSDQEVQLLVERIIGPGLQVPLHRQGWGHDYHTTITLTGGIGNIRDGNVLRNDSTQTGQRVKDVQGSEHTGNRGSKVEGGVQGRVLGNIGVPGALIMGVKGTKAWTDGDKISSGGKTNYDRKQGDTLTEDGSLGNRDLRQFRADLHVDVDVESTKRLAKQWRKLSFGSPGRHAPPSHPVGTRQSTDIDVTFLLPDTMTSEVDPRTQPRARPNQPVRMANPPAPDNLTPGGPRDLDGAQLVGFTGTRDILASAQRVLTRASGQDPIFTTKDGKNSDILGNRFSPEAYRGDTRVFSRPVVADGLHYGRRRADAFGAVGVKLTPRLSARQVTAAEYEQVTKEFASSQKVSGSTSTTGTFGGFVTGVAVPTSNPTQAGGTNVGGQGVLIGNVNIATATWGKGTTGELESGETLTVTGDPERKYLTRVDITAEVVGQVQYKGNLDFDLTSPDDPERSGETLDLPESALVWLTADQLQALQSGQNNPVPRPQQHAPDRTVAPPPSMTSQGSQKQSIGLGGITSTMDLTRALPNLRADLARTIGQDAADRLLPHSGFDTTHNNHREITRFLSDVNRGAQGLLNGGKIAPLRLEDRFSGQTYEFNAKATLRAPRFDGITNVDKLKFSNTTTLTTQGDTTKGFTPTGVYLSGRGLLTLRDVPDPLPTGTPPPTTGHGPATGAMGAGAGLAQNFGDRSVKSTDKGSTAYEQSGETSGPVAKYQSQVRVELSITRHGETVGRATVDDRVSITKLAEDTLPPPQGSTRARPGRLGQHRPTTTVDPLDRTPGALQHWRGRQAGGNPAPQLTTGTFFTEHYLGDLDVLRDAAVRAVRESGAKITPATERAIRAAITPASVKAGIQSTMDGTFRLPLPKGLDRTLEVHGRVPHPPRFAGTSATVKVDGSVKTTEEHKTEVTSTSGPEVTTTAPVGSGGVVGPSGADSPNEDRPPFGSATGSAQRDATVLKPAPDGKHQESYTTTKDKTANPKSDTETKSDEKVTRTVLSDFEFRFVARQTSKPWFGSAHTGATEVQVRDAYALRLRDDHATTFTGRPLPDQLKQATTDLADKAKAWGTAHKETLGRQAAVDTAPHGAPTPAQTQALADAQRKEQQAEREWWDAYRTHQQEVAAEQARTPGGGRPSRPAPPAEGRDGIELQDNPRRDQDDQDRRDQQDRDRQERERQDRDRQERERQDRERQDRERQERERQERERQERERQEREKQERERQEREKQERERQERERQERERQEREKQERERQERERQEREKQERERQEREKQERERQEREKQEREKQEREKQERERQEREKQERERQEREKQEQEKQEREKQAREQQERQQEQDRLERERLERERADRERQEQERERQERERQERERAERERQAAQGGQPTAGPSDAGPGAQEQGRPAPLTPENLVAHDLEWGREQRMPGGWDYENWGSDGDSDSFVTAAEWSDTESFYSADDGGVAPPPVPITTQDGTAVGVGFAGPSTGGGGAPGGGGQPAGSVELSTGEAVGAGFTSGGADG